MGGINKFSSSQIEAMIEVIGVGLNLSAGTLTSILSKNFTFSEGTGAVYEMSAVDGSSFQPALAVIIENSGLLDGKCIALVKYIDVQNILSIFMNGDVIPDDNFELDELTFSTVKEIINQAVSACAVQLSEFLGGNVQMSLSDVVSFESNDMFAAEFGGADYAMVLDYGFSIENSVNSSLMCVIPENLAGQLDEKVNASSAEPEIIDSKPQEAEPEHDNNYISPSSYSGRKTHKSSERQINIQSGQFPDFSKQTSAAAKGLNGNMDILMDVPLNVSIEIGKTKKKMKEILEFGQGTIIALEKQAGAPVDVVVNGQLIARGDVVVIDDNFGVRITEVIGNTPLLHEEQGG